MCSGRRMKRLMKPRWSAYPKAPNTTAAPTIVTKGSSASPWNAATAAYIASAISSPCAKLTSLITPKMADRPSAISP